jgi:uncharacterized membrane protein
MSETSTNARLEAFCDAVFAIALTLLIIDIKIPATVEIKNVADFWHALSQIAPSIIAFVLSFIIIFITWVNHHSGSKLISGSSHSLIYANGFLLLTVVFIPFPTSLLGEYLFTDHSSPAVILYNSILALQALGWIALTQAALSNNLERSEKARVEIKKNNRYGYFALGLYTICAIVAIWFPMIIATITIVSWLVWLVVGINTKEK